MPIRPDLAPAAERLTQVLAGIGDDQLSSPTPCRGATVADLLDHVDGLCRGFIDAAAKTPGTGDAAPSAEATRLTPDWRTRIPARLAQLANAWQAEQAWEGMTRAGGVDMPGEVTGRVALNELVVHGWDLAAATGQPYSVQDAAIEGAAGFVDAAVQQNPGGTPGLFGPPVPVAKDATPLDRLIAATGRDPGWRGANYPAVPSEASAEASPGVSQPRQSSTAR